VIGGEGGDAGQGGGCEGGLTGQGGGNGDSVWWSRLWCAFCGVCGYSQIPGPLEQAHMLNFVLAGCSSGWQKHRAPAVQVVLLQCVGREVHRLKQASEVRMQG